MVGDVTEPVTVPLTVLSVSSYHHSTLDTEVSDRDTRVVGTPTATLFFKSPGHRSHTGLGPKCLSHNGEKFRRQL